MSDHRGRGRRGVKAFTQWFSRLSQPSTRAGDTFDAGDGASFVPRPSSSAHGVPFGDPDLYVLAGLVAGELDNEHRALLSCYVALRKACFWPYGPSPVDDRGQFSMRSIATLLATHHVTLSLDIDLGADLYGLLVYPARTVFMNPRFFAGWQNDQIAHGALRTATLMLFAAYLIQPAYIDVLPLPFGFENASGGPLINSLWRTASWMALEMMLPAPLINIALREFARRQQTQYDTPKKPSTPLSEVVARYVHATPAAHIASSIAGCSAEFAQLKINQFTEGIARAMGNHLDYGRTARNNPLWPYATREVAEVLSTYDWTTIHTLGGSYLKHQQQARSTGSRHQSLFTSLPTSLPTLHATPTPTPRHVSHYPLSPTSSYDIRDEVESESESESNTDIGSGPLGPLPFRI